MVKSQLAAHTGCELSLAARWHAEGEQGKSYTNCATPPVGEWNTVKIVRRGPQITVTHNGQVVHDFDQSENPHTKDKPLCGYFSVQNHNKEI